MVNGESERMISCRSGGTQNLTNGVWPKGSKCVCISIWAKKAFYTQIQASSSMMKGIAPRDMSISWH
jgi:hypothetical protein